MESLKIPSSIFGILRLMILASLPISFILIIALMIMHINRSLILGLYSIIAIWMGTVLYLFTKPLIQVGFSSGIKFENLHPRLYKLLVSSFFFLESIALLQLYVYPMRNFVHYSTLSLLALIIFVQICMFHSKGDLRITMIIILEIYILYLTIIWGGTLKYPYFFGRTDLIAHVWWVENLINKGHVTNVFSTYKPFPLWHILNTEVYWVSGFQNFAINKLVIFTSGICLMTFVLVIYLLGHQLSKNTELSLLTTLLAATYFYSVFYGMYSLPRSMTSLVLTPMIFYMLLTTKKDLRYSMILILLGMATILYHTASMPFILVVMLVLYLTLAIQEDSNAGQRGYLKNTTIIYTIMLLFYWGFYGGIVFNSVTRTFYSFIMHFVYGENSNIFAHYFSSPDTIVREFVNYLQFTLYLTFIILTILYYSDKDILKKTRITELGTYILWGIVFIPIIFPSPIMSSKWAFQLNLTRFGSYTVFPVVLSMALSVYILTKIKVKKMHKIVALLIFLMILLSISNDFTASDNPLVKRQSYTWYFTENEIASMKFLPMVSTRVMMDNPAKKYIRYSPYGGKQAILELSPSKNIVKPKEWVAAIRLSEIRRGRELQVYVTEHFIFPSYTTRTYVRYVYITSKDIERYRVQYTIIYSSQDVVGMK